MVGGRSPLGCRQLTGGGITSEVLACHMHTEQWPLPSPCSRPRVLGAPQLLLWGDWARPSTLRASALLLQRAH